MNGTPKVTVLIPVFNEKRTILAAIEDARTLPVTREIIVIDNCSTDGTRELLAGVRDPQVRIILQGENLGYGTSLKTGIGLAQGEYIYVHMSDREYDIAGCPPMLSRAERDGCDAVFGSRLKEKPRHPMTLIRERPEYAATLLCTAMINRWYRRSFTDVLGSRLYRTESVRKVPISARGVGFEFEHTTRMCKAGFRIAELAVPYTPRPHRREKKVKPYHLFLALYTMVRIHYGTTPLTKTRA